MLIPEKDDPMKDSLLPLCLLIVFLGCSEAPQAQPAKAPEIPVTVAQVVSKDMPLAVDAPGTVEPVRTVTILSRITGQLEKIGFREGEDVVKGRTLFTLDQAPFLEEVKKAESRLLQNKALLKFQMAEARRYENITKGGAVSESDVEKTRAQALATQALIQADGAALEQARLDHSYCTIKAPFSGRTGRYLVNEGAIVEANITPLTVIHQISPIDVSFSVPERRLPQIQRFWKQHPLKVLASPGEEKTPRHEGKLVFLDNAIDTATGMLFLKARFENRDRGLWPGQYVRASLILYHEKNAVTVPKRAVMLGQKGNYVFVVKPDMTVESREVAVDRRVDGDAVIASGLKPGETVVLTGQNKLQKGFHVEILTPSRHQIHRR